jgi:hypothetical protein
MPESRSRSTSPSLTKIEHARCPKCAQVRMNLARIEPGPEGFEIRRFECVKCDHATTVFFEHKTR